MHSKRDYWHNTITFQKREWDLKICGRENQGLNQLKSLHIFNSKKETRLPVALSTLHPDLRKKNFDCFLLMLREKYIAFEFDLFHSSCTKEARDTTGCKT